MTGEKAAPADARTLALVELLSILWQERRAIQDMANDPSASDADLRSLCRAIALPPTAEDMAWAMKQMESLP